MQFLLKIWFKLPEKLRFLLVGGFNTVISYTIFAGLIFLIGESKYQQSLVLSWILSSFISFSTQKIFVFQTKGNWIKEYSKCLLTWSIGYVINAGALEVVVKLLHLNVYIGQALSILVTMIMSYILFKYFAFKDKSQVRISNIKSSS